MTQADGVGRGPLTAVIDSLAWRIPVWTVLTVATVLQAQGLEARVVAGVLMGSGALAFQFVRHQDTRVRMAVVVYASVVGLGATLAAPQGLAEVLVFVVASRAPVAFDGAPLRAFVVIDTVAVGATIGYISQSLPGILAGLVVPLLVQRAVEQRDLVRERDRATALLVEAEAGREAEAQAAALRERGRIAREMHDVLAHSLAGLSVQLQATRAVAAREGVGPVVLEPLDKAADLARAGLAEARAAVSTLRDPVGLGLDALPALVARHPGEAVLTGADTAAAVAPEAGHALYRAVQESLTNAVRYAPGSAVTVVLRRHDETLEAAVSDTGPGHGREAVGGPSTGLGLAGMAERLASVGGRVEAGPSGTGWLVRIVVPLEES